MNDKTSITPFKQGKLCKIIIIHFYFHIGKNAKIYFDVKGSQNLKKKTKMPLNSFVIILY